MRHARQDFLLEVGEDPFHRLRRFGAEAAICATTSPGSTGRTGRSRSVLR